MSNEKYLNYAGLQYYHEKLNLDLASMLMTDDDLDIILLDELGIVPPLPETWTESANGTLNLALGNAFSYWPEGAGTKTISITNGTTAGISKFFLKLTDAGNFFVEWGSNIQWKNGSEPEWQAFYEDIVLFTSKDNGSTWTGQVLQTNAITPYWKVTIQTTSNNEYVLLPFDCDNIKIVDWGDGNIDNYNYYSYIEGISESQSYVSSYNPKHIYTTSGSYKIKMMSENFGYIQNLDVYYSGSSSEKYYHHTLISIDSPLPSLSGSYVMPGSTPGEEDNNFEYIFAWCKQLVSIPDKLFYNNSQCSTFSDAFWDCYSLTSIPAGLFDRNTIATNFSRCFEACSSLTSIPEGLFDHNTQMTDVQSCFEACSSLTSIPEGLFDHNTQVTSFYKCFQNCTSLVSIPSGLFDKNTAVTDFSYCFYDSTFTNSINNFTLSIGSSSVYNAHGFINKKDGTTRTIQVPSGSTTQTTFNSVASSLGLTIVGV